MNYQYELGDTVRVRSYEEIACQFAYDRVLPSGCHFRRAMEKFCGRECTITYRANIGGARYKISATEEWWFTDEMLESVDCAGNDNAAIEISFDDMMGF